MRDFSESWGNVSQGLSLVNQDIEVEDKSDAKRLVVRRGEIVFDKVSFGYLDGEQIFDNTSLTIYPGQRVGIVGMSGVGKSTFVHLLLRLFDVSSGRILIDGQDISQVTQESLRDAVGAVLQDPSLFHRELIDNIRYGSNNASAADVIEAASLAHADGFISRLPSGYHTMVGERGVKLSGGQRQRIAIARTVLKNAPILVLDESTSHLDSLTEGLVKESLAQITEGKTTIVIAHRLSTLSNMDRILVFERGKIVEDGTHASLIGSNGAYASLYSASQSPGLIV